MQKPTTLLLLVLTLTGCNLFSGVDDSADAAPVNDAGTDVVRDVTDNLDDMRDREDAAADISVVDMALDKDALIEDAPDFVTMDMPPAFYPNDHDRAITVRFNDVPSDVNDIVLGFDLPPSVVTESDYKFSIYQGMDAVPFTRSQDHVWVRIPLLSRATDELRIFWGGPNAIDASDVVGVWGDHELVMHFDTGIDSVRPPDVANVTGVDNYVAGIHGNAIDLANATLTIPHHDGFNVRANEPLVVEFWSYYSLRDGIGEAEILRMESNCIGWSVWAWEGAFGAQTGVSEGCTPSAFPFSGLTVPFAQQWRHIIGVYDPPNLEVELYVDGVIGAFGEAIDPAAVTNYEIATPIIIAPVNADKPKYDGLIDELRIHRKRPTSAYIAARRKYADDSAITIGAPQSRP